MAKGTGLIGNFHGKVGNMVGYNLKDSNNKQTQGVRVYQPIVKNPKTAAQAEQRAKLLAVNATYRALKMVIDRGNETLPYGNKSRLAWLKGALKSEKMPWIEKGMPVTSPVGCQLTKGSLTPLAYSISGSQIAINSAGVASSTPVETVRDITAALMMGNGSLKLGDQITVVYMLPHDNALQPIVFSFVLSDKDTTAISGFAAGSSEVKFSVDDNIVAGAIIISREGNNGEHLRSTEYLAIEPGTAAGVPYDADSKAAAIASYRASAATSGDWAEESVQ